MKRVIFYFDGFNFYNGLKDIAVERSEWKNFYWINFVRFCSQFLESEHELIEVKYFTAPPSDNNQRSRQSALFAANKILNGEKFNTIKGTYQDRTIICKKCKKDFKHPEEKRTDVNIATTMLLDCFKDKADILVLVSADSDQVPTIRAIQSEFPEKNVKVYFPPNRSSTELFNIAKPVVYLENNKSRFQAAVMPVVVESEGKRYTRPDTWQG